MLLNEECVNYSAYCIEGVLVGLQIRQHMEPIIYTRLDAPLHHLMAFPALIPSYF